MLMYGDYKTTHVTTPISVTSAGVVHVTSASSAGLTYVATPTSGKLTTMEVFTVNTASFTGGKIISGTNTATSTNITAGLYLCSARGNSFFCRIGGTAASLTTVTFPIYESESRVLRLNSAKLSTICTSATGKLTLVRLV